MIKELNNKSLAYGVPGLLVQTIGLFLHPLITLLGSVFLIIGLAYYSKAKGHSGYFGLFGLVSLIGIIVLLSLKDLHKTPEEEEARKKTRPRDIILGVILGLGLVIGIPVILALIFMKFAK